MNGGLDGGFGHAERGGNLEISAGAVAGEAGLQQLEAAGLIAVISAQPLHRALHHRQAQRRSKTSSGVTGSAGSSR
jgi:hypothetical protein